MWFWWLLGALAVFVVAAVSIGLVSGSLARRPRRSVYDLEEAVEFVADRLPEELTARLSYDDVRAVLTFHCDYLAAKGVASQRTADDIGTGLVVVPDDEPVAVVIGRVEDAGLELDDTDVITILDTEVEYYRAIGAIGPELGVEDPDPDTP